MKQEMLINVREEEECRIAIVQDGVLEELYIERTDQDTCVGNIYKGVVVNLEPSIQAAFVDFGIGRNGFLHITDVEPQYFRQAGYDPNQLLIAPHASLEGPTKGIGGIGEADSSNGGDDLPGDWPEESSVSLAAQRVYRTSGRPRFKPPIQEIFRRGDQVIVQVIKEGVGNKGPTLSTYISIPGRYLVLMPPLGRVGVSRKIEDAETRRRLRQLMAELKPPKGLGFIVRTAGADRTKKDLSRDLAYLLRLWKVIYRRIKKLPAPCPIYEESDLIIRTIRDIFTSDVDCIYIDEERAYQRAREFLQLVMPRFVNRLKLYTGKEPLFHKYGLEKEIAKIHQRVVPLKEGGSIVIDQTEALVAIDVNSGSFRVDDSAEETAYQLNLIAAKEIARQIRLRDLGGVIVNDFIDMRKEKHRRAVERALREALKRDRARIKILRTSPFGLIEMTRQRMRPSLRSFMYTTCPTCHGTGVVKTAETMALEVIRVLLPIAALHPEVKRIQVTVAPEVADHLNNKKRRKLLEIEEDGQRSIEILSAPGVSSEYLQITCFDEEGREVPVEDEE